MSSKKSKKDKKQRKADADKKQRKADADKKGALLARKKKHAGCKGEKSAAGCKGCEKAKTALKIEHCTCCKKHCPLSKPKCGKGRRLAAALKLREKKA